MSQNSICRTKSRKERYLQKKDSSYVYPIALATTNLIQDKNVGSLIRTVACFGLSHLSIIGGMPSRSVLKPISGSLVDYVDIRVYSTEEEYLEFIHCNDRTLVALELSAYSLDIREEKNVISWQDYPMDIFVGHEELGVPGPILSFCDLLFEIPMDGFGWCLNTSQAAHIGAWEMINKYKELEKKRNYNENNN